MKFIQSFLKNSEYIRAALWRYRSYVFFGLIALAIVDVLEAVAPLLVKRAVDLVVVHGVQQELFEIAGIYLLITIVQGLGRYGWRMYLIRSSLYAGRDMRLKFSDHLMHLSASFFDRKRVGDLMSMAVSDVEAVRMAIGAGVLTFADAVFYLISIPIAMFWLSPKLALISFAPILVVPWVVIYCERRIHERFQKTQESLSELSAMAQENINGIRVVKSFAREDAQIRRFEAMGREYVQLNLRLNRVQSIFGPVLDFVTCLGLVGVLLFGGKDVMQGSLTIGTLIAFHRYFQKMAWPMTALGMAFTLYERAVASTDRVRGILVEKSDIVESPAPKLPEGASLKSSPSRWKTAGKIEFRKLSFRYRSDLPWVLKDLDLTIEAGERIGILGAIGSGKSTLLSLIPRMYPIDPGMLFVDGVDVNHWPLKHLRAQIGYVGQEVFLFKQSVWENVAMGFSEGAPEQAIRLAAIEGEVKVEDGVDLSGGQKQRLTIARALVREPSILILDDALASVDVETEGKILENLASRPGKKTELFAVHRVSVVQSLDRIVMMDHGKIIQMGTHVQLMQERSGLYRRYYDQQNLENELTHYAHRVGKEANS